MRIVKILIYRYVRTTWNRAALPGRNVDEGLKDQPPKCQMIYPSKSNSYCTPRGGTPISITLSISSCMEGKDVGNVIFLIKGNEYDNFRLKMYSLRTFKSEIENMRIMKSSSDHKEFMC